MLRTRKTKLVIMPEVAAAGVVRVAGHDRGKRVVFLSRDPRYGGPAPRGRRFRRQALRRVRRQCMGSSPSDATSRAARALSVQVACGVDLCGHAENSRALGQDHRVPVGMALISVEAIAPGLAKQIDVHPARRIRPRYAGHSPAESECTSATRP